MGIAKAPLLLDPRLATDATSARVCRLLYARLVDFDDAFHVVPALARWEAVTPTEYLFHLGEAGRTFHDGTRLTAADVVATYRSLLDPALASPHRTALENLVEIAAVDPNTVRVRLRHPDPLFPAALIVGILPARLAQPVPVSQPLGSGPLRFVEWPTEGLLRLRRVADGQPIELLAVGNTLVRALKLLHGEIDLMQGDLSPELNLWLRGRAGIVVRTAPGTSFSYLGFHMEDPVTGRPEVREAIALAVDRAEIVHYVLAGEAHLGDGPLPRGHWAGLPDSPPPRPDPAAARAILARLGYGPSNPLPLSYKTSTDPLRLRIATIIQSQLNAVGFAVSIKSHDFGTFFEDIKAGKFQMYGLQWVGIKTPDLYRYVFHSASVPPVGANRGRYRSAAVDRLIEAAELAPTREQALPLYREVTARVHADRVFQPLWYEDTVVVLRAGVTGYVPHPDGNFDGLAQARRDGP
jgi:peptide/nickel transport system substrate-binding protein